jgi:hypothetical protein
LALEQHWTLVIREFQNREREKRDTLFRRKREERYSVSLVCDSRVFIICLTCLWYEIKWLNKMFIIKTTRFYLQLFTFNPWLISQN